MTEVKRTVPRFRVCDVLPSGYTGFQDYCTFMGKVYCDEIGYADIYSYATWFGRGKGEITWLYALMEAFSGILAGSVRPYRPDHTREGPAQYELGFEQDRYEIDRVYALADAYEEQGPRYEIDGATLFDHFRARHLYISDSWWDYDPIGPDAQDLCRWIASYGKMDPVQVPMMEELARSVSGLVQKDPEETYGEIYHVDMDQMLADPVPMKLYDALSDGNGRLYDILADNDCADWRDLLRTTPAQLQQLPRVGKKSVEKIEGILRSAFSDMQILRREVLLPVISAMLQGQPYDEVCLSLAEREVLARVEEEAGRLEDDTRQVLLSGSVHERTDTIIKMLTDPDHIRRRIVDSARQEADLWDPPMGRTWLMTYLQLFYVVRKGRTSAGFQEIMARCAYTKVEEYGALIAHMLDTVDADLTLLWADLDAFQVWMGMICLEDLCHEVFDRSPAFDMTIPAERAQWCRRIQSRATQGAYDLLGLIAAYRNGQMVLSREDIIDSLGPIYGKLTWSCATQMSGAGPGIHYLDSEIAHYDEREGAVIVHALRGRYPQKEGEIWPR